MSKTLSRQRTVKWIRVADKTAYIPATTKTTPIDYMGDDAAVVQAARISYGDGTKKMSDDEHLIRYLMRHRHTTPTEMAEIKLHFRVPMDDHRQIIRHRTASVNEYSTRYSDVIRSTRKTKPDEWRIQSGENKQGSQEGELFWPRGWTIEPAQERDYEAVLLNPKGKVMMEIPSLKDFTQGSFLTAYQKYVHARGQEFYDILRAFGIAHEQSRQNIVISTYTEYYWKIDVHNLLHFLKLRMDSHAQWEIRQYANAIAEIIMKWLPLTWAAFNDYVLHAVTLTLRDQTVLRHVMQGRTDLALSVAETYGWGKSSRERKEFVKKLATIGVDSPWNQLSWLE